MGVTLAGTGKVLFELPVYRLSEEMYYDKFNLEYEKRKTPNNDPISEEKINQNIFKDYGGAWKYNEIIGYLELYAQKSDIRCAYYKVNAKRIVRTRKKQYEIYDDTIYKIDIFRKYTNEQLIVKIKELVDNCILQDEFENRFVDRKLFDKMVDYVDWYKLIYDDN